MYDARPNSQRLTSKALYSNVRGFGEGTATHDEACSLVYEHPIRGCPEVKKQHLATYATRIAVAIVGSAHLELPSALYRSLSQHKAWKWVTSAKHDSFDQIKSLKQENQESCTSGRRSSSLLISISER